MTEGQGRGLRIGVDLGGTNLRIAAFRDGATPLVVRREPVGDDRGPEAVIARLGAIIEDVRAEVAGPGDGGPLPVGVGVAAMLSDRKGTVANAPNLRWFDVPFGPMLAARLGARARLGVYNDVNAIVWGEHQQGAAVGASDVLGVYVGTGIGGGLVAGDALVEGASNTAGEIGHTKVRWDERAAPCECGARGCLEAYAGGASVLRRIRNELASGAKTRAVEIAGGVDRVTPGDVDEAAAGGDEWALGLWTELAPLLGIALANSVVLFNPEVLVLGGGMLSRTPVLREQALAAMTVATTPAALAPLRVCEPVLGDDAGLVGAALLAEAGVSCIAAP
jgi:glucokinase